MNRNNYLFQIFCLALIIGFLLGACGEITTPNTSTTEVPTEMDEESVLPTSTTLPASGPKVNYTTTGTIRDDEIWRDEIYLSGDINFANRATLTIEPGTTVFFASNSDDRHANDTGGCFDDYTCRVDDPTLQVGWGANAILLDGRGGTIYAIGTQEDPIIFRPEGDSTSPGQYDGIYIESGALKYTKLLFGSGVQALGNYGSVEIAFNEVRHFLIAGIDAHTTEVWIHHNIIEGGGHHAIGVHKDGVIVENNLVMNCQTGVNLHQQDKVTVRNNIIVDCTIGIAVNGTNNTIENNTIVQVDGPPDGWYYQDQLVYPGFGMGGGIMGSTEGPERIVNNIIYGPFQWAIAYLGSEPVNGAHVEYNIFWDTLEDFGGPGQTVISSNNSNINPEFVDPSNRDFHLMPSSLAIDAGSPDVEDTDGSPSDIGAYGGAGSGSW